MLHALHEIKTCMQTLCNSTYKVRYLVCRNHNVVVVRLWMRSALFLFPGVIRSLDASIYLSHGFRLYSAYMNVFVCSGDKLASDLIRSGTVEIGSNPLRRRRHCNQPSWSICTYVLRSNISLSYYEVTNLESQSSSCCVCQNTFDWRATAQGKELLHERDSVLFCFLIKCKRLESKVRC